MKKLLLLLSLACSIAATANVPYRVISPFLNVEDGAIAILSDYDTGAPIDSAVVSEGAAVFTGDIDEPIMARITVNGKRFGSFILEQGTTAINQKSRMASGTMLNDKLNTLVDQIETEASAMQALDSEEAINAAYAALLSNMRQMVIDNLDSPIGYVVFLDYAQAINAKEMMEFIKQHPELKDYRRVQGLIEAASKKLATSEGQPFTDFEITYNGKTQKLSDYVGKGKYTLVDFWASWCGPCRQEIKNTLKPIYAEYADKGLQVLGVAVWDTPADTEVAIRQMDIPWPNIINAQTIPTDIYGISGIPCIILFAPDGTIVSRDLQGAALKAEVAKAMASVSEAPGK